MQRLFILLSAKSKCVLFIFHCSQLFDHIAHCLQLFIREHKLDTETLPLGFTFSFPCRQEGLTAARLVKWTKGFKCSGVEGEDVVRLLREAVSRTKVVFIMDCLMFCIKLYGYKQMTIANSKLQESV